MNGKRNGSRIAATVVLVGVTVSLFTGCVTQAKQEPQAAPQLSSSAPESPAVLTLGGSYTYTNGVTVLVSTSTPYQPGQYAAAGTGMVDQSANNVVFTMTVRNGGKDPYDPTMFQATLSAANQACSQIFDAQNNVLLPPQTTVLPGTELSWQTAFSCPAPAGSSAIMDVRPSFQYNEKTFTGTV